MIGRYQIQLGSDQFTSGMSSTDYTSDGALGVESTGLNPFISPGAIYSMAAPTDLHANLVDNLIASCEDSQIGTTISNNRLMIGDAGNYYKFASPSTVTKVATATTNSAYYIASLTDMVGYIGNTYISTGNGDIDQYNSSSATLTNAYWSNTLSQPLMNKSGGTNVPHPMLVYSGILYIAGQNNSTGAGTIHGINSSGTVDTFFPALPLLLNTNEVIYALGIDPITGLMLISAQTELNIAGSLSSKYYVYLWDGVSAQYYRKIPVDDLITAFHNVEGTVYVGAGTNFGVWNGNGVTFLRKLLNAAETSTDLIYKHHITNTRNIIHVTDGSQVLSYGTVVAGKPKGFFYTANSTGANHLQCIFPTGDYNLGVGDGVGSFWLWSFTSSSAGTGALFTNDIYFPRPIFIRRVRILTTGITTTTGIGTVKVEDESDNTRTPVVDSFVVSSGTKYLFDFEFAGYKMMSIQPAIAFSTQGFGIIRMWIYYDIAE